MKSHKNHHYSSPSAHQEINYVIHSHFHLSTKYMWCIHYKSITIHLYPHIFHSNVVKTIINHPFQNDLYRLFMVIWGFIIVLNLNHINAILYPRIFPYFPIFSMLSHGNPPKPSQRGRAPRAGAQQRRLSRQFQAAQHGRDRCEPVDLEPTKLGKNSRSKWENQYFIDDDYFINYHWYISYLLLRYQWDISIISIYRW